MKKKVEVGTERVVRRFAIIPMVVDNVIKWMRPVYILQKYLIDNHANTCYWMDLAFVTRADYKAFKEKVNHDTENA